MGYLKDTKGLFKNDVTRVDVACDQCFKVENRLFKGCEKQLKCIGFLFCKSCVNSRPKKNSKQSSIQVGQKFGRLTVQEASEPRFIGRSKKPMWKCVCDCGKTKTVQANNLVTGRSATCGCANLGIPNLKARKPFGMAAANHAYNGYKNGAKRRGLDFFVSIDQFMEFGKQTCFYCGSLPSNELQLKNKDGSQRCYGSYIYNGIDRLDNNKGYVDGNMVTCCRKCNRAKDVLSAKDFIELALNISKIWTNREIP